MKRKYYIDNDSETFATLSDAKFHIWMSYTPDERIKHLKSESIIGLISDNVMSITPILIDKVGGFRFGKTKRVINNL